MKRSILSLILLLALSISTFAQQANPANWYNLDPKKDKALGVSTERAYQKLIKKKSGEDIIVAVIDSGIDIHHEDLKNIIWVNTGEIAGNGKDDDGNGYIDDVYGWNFIGGANGNVKYDNLELTRLVRKYSEQFEGKSVSALTAQEQETYERYQALKKELEQERQELAPQAGFYKALYEALVSLKGKMGKDEPTKEDVAAVEAANQAEAQAKQILTSALDQASYNDLMDELKEAVDYFSSRVDYHLNLDFDPREIVGDDYDDPTERYYGNSDVIGEDARHGTHVAGIIAAQRNNQIGINGVAQNVQIMVIRAVPDGDERDKDVANAIRYAVDNGAKVINMSFGKAYSWNKAVVDEAIAYAAEKDVLLVHAAGNDNKDNDVTDNFPNDEVLEKPDYANVWLEIGASTIHEDQRIPASFSNYGKTQVDVFAPGYEINSTVPGSKYENLSGTSMAAPVVSGVAALIRSYYPNLTAAEVKDIILQSARKIEEQVILPGEESVKVPFADLSQTGAVVNAFDAMKLAKKVSKKKK
ncbi:S8 family peptidase [Penaeicola halotolerans]|uniref:S8 family peptidase n=1 Tax=Penaeicola halotolerans TaxID=2793196 RepID=UPI001CF8E8CD|nr:S8 family peptidase [Penaeicola halotolerans]